MRLMRPTVRCNAAMSADGKVNASGGQGRFASPRDRQRMDYWRAQADVVVVGAGTVRADNPIMHVRCPQALAQRRAGDFASVQPQVVVIMGRHGLPPGTRLLAAAAAEVVLVGCAAAPVVMAGPLPAHVRIWQVGQQQVAPAALLARLAAAGARRVLIEGGGQTLWHFAAAGLVDEVCVTIVPRLLGGHAAPTWLGGAGWGLADAPHLKLLSCTAVDDEIYARWQLLPTSRPA